MENQLIEALKMAYRKHHLEDERVGWDQLSTVLYEALSEAMGDAELIAWTREVLAGMGYRGASDFA